MFLAFYWLPPLCVKAWVMCEQRSKNGKRRGLSVLKMNEQRRERLKQEEEMMNSIDEDEF
jgi:hypothetical protein